MTMINVNYPTGRITLEQRRLLAEGLTDAVLVPEVGQYCPPAREGSRSISPSVQQITWQLAGNCCQISLNVMWLLSMFW